MRLTGRVPSRISQFGIAENVLKNEAGQQLVHPPVASDGRHRGYPPRDHRYHHLKPAVSLDGPAR